MNTDDINQNTPVTATLVPIEQRPDILFRHFGPACLAVERLMYAWARHLSPEYNGGFWEFFELSNGGFYIAPVMPGPIRFVCDGNGCDCELSPDAFGIVVCLFAFSDSRYNFADFYWNLHDYLDDHPDVALIYEAID